MTFIEQWRRELRHSLSEFVRPAAEVKGIDFTYGLLATAVLWPIRERVQAYDGDALDAIRELAGVPGKHILKAVQGWGEDRLAAARSLGVQAAENPELRETLNALLETFAPAILSDPLTAQAGTDSIAVAQQIRAALVNIGGTITIEELNIQLPQHLEIPPPPVETLFDYLLNMLRGQDFLLCFDDFHFMDDDPLLLQLVERLRDVVAEGEMAIVVTSRRVPDFVRIAEFKMLTGLTLADTRQLLLQRGLALPDKLAADLHAQTAGNAEFLTLAIDALQQSDDPARLIGRLAETDDMERYLLQEVDEHLQEDEREVMGAIAVLLAYPGTRAALEAILNGRNVRATLRQLRDRHLLITHESAAGKAYGQHAMVQAFYYDLLGRPQKRQMHQRAGEYYEMDEKDWLKAARHYERAGEYGKAAELATADVWALINEGQALPLHDLLERLNASPLVVEQGLQVALALGQLCTFVGDREDAEASYQKVLASLAQFPDTPAADVLIARVCRGMGELLEQESPHEALHWLQRGLAELVEDDSLEGAALHIHSGTVQMHLGNYPEALQALASGLERLPQGPSQLRANALKNLAAVYMFQGDIERSTAHSLQALESSQQLHDHFQAASILINLGVTKYIDGDWASGIADLKQGLAAAERLGSAKITTSLEVNLGIAYINTAEDDLAFDHLQRGLDLARKHQLHQIATIALLRLADLHIRRGEWEPAQNWLQEAKQLAVAIDVESSLTGICSGLAELQLARGEIAAALEDAHRSVDLARELGEDLEEGSNLRVLGQVLLASGQQQSALDAFAQSLALLEDEDIYEAARTKMQWGAALLANGDSDRGKALLQEAQATFAQLGAARDLTLTAAILQSHSI